MNPKLGRFYSDENLQKIRAMPCAICLASPPNHAHHMKTKGAGGDDKLENLLPLCPPHHSEFHCMGVRSWKKKYGDRVTEFRRLNDLPTPS